MQTRLEIGQIVNTFGIKGEVKVTPFTDDINRFDDLKKVYVRTRKEEKLYKVENAKYTVEIDPSIIGGIKVIVGNKIYDNSIDTQLKQMI